MRILHIIPRLNKGGAERLCLDICNELQKHSDAVVQLITFSEQNAYTDLTQNIDWKIIPSSVQLSVLGKNKYNISDLQKAIESFAPDVIHTHLFEAEIVSRSCCYTKAKWFSHCHDNMKQFRNCDYKTVLNKETFTNYYEKCYLFRRYKATGGTHFVAISQNSAEYFAKTASRFSIDLLPNAINYSRFSCKNKITDRNTIRLINVGSYADKKNQKLLVEVAKVLKSRSVNFEMNLLGDGKNFNKIKQQIIDSNLSDCVFQLGNVANVEEYLWKSDVYVHSAYYEPLGLALLEAMAAGLPLVTLDGKGNRDIIKEGENGYMLYEQNAELFADKIIELWQNEPKYCEMSKSAQDFAKQYDIKDYVDKLFAIYEEEL